MHSFFHLFQSAEWTTTEPAPVSIKFWQVDHQKLQGYDFIFVGTLPFTSIGGAKAVLILTGTSSVIVRQARSRKHKMLWEMCRGMSPAEVKQDSFSLLGITD